MQNSGDKALTTKVKKYYVNFQGSLGKNHVNSRGLKMNILNDDSSFMPDGLLKVGRDRFPLKFLKPKTQQKIQFNPTQTIALIIGNVKYDGIKYTNLDNVEQNIKKVEEIIKFLGIKEVKYLIDFTMEDLRKIINYVKSKFRISLTSPKIKTFLFVYYAGHGLIKNGMTEIVLNNNDSYNLEAELREMAAGNQNTFTMAVFDACREYLELA